MSSIGSVAPGSPAYTPVVRAPKSPQPQPAPAAPTNDPDHDGDSDGPGLDVKG